MPETRSTIRFHARSSSLVTLPPDASAELAPQGQTMVEGTINGFPFRAALEPDGQLRMDRALHRAAGASQGETLTIEITRIGAEPEVRMPAELGQALAAAPRAEATWEDITPLARRDWILWIVSGKQEETRTGRIARACDMLASGKRRVCCFGGLRWLVKDHPSVETWQPLKTDRTGARQVVGPSPKASSNASSSR